MKEVIKLMIKWNVIRFVFINIFKFIKLRIRGLWNIKIFFRIIILEVLICWNIYINISFIKIIMCEMNRGGV